jgi:hypothetical protein
MLLGDCSGEFTILGCLVNSYFLFGGPDVLPLLLYVSLLGLNRLRKVPVDSFGSDTWPCGVVSIFGCLDLGIFGWEARGHMQIPDSLGH